MLALPYLPGSLFSIKASSATSSCLRGSDLLNVLVGMKTSTASLGVTCLSLSSSGAAEAEGPEPEEAGAGDGQS